MVMGHEGKGLAREVVLAREYLRVSVDRSGRERSNEEQQGDNRAAWPGFEWGDHYRDRGSASRYATRARGDYDDLVADLRSGRFGAQVLVLWENSRGSRRVGEWVELIELCEAGGVQIAVTTHRRIYDPANPRDRRTLIDDANDAEYESAKDSLRTRRAMRDNAVAGRPHGRVPYGYRRRYDEVSRRLVAQEPYEPEAAVVRELFARLRKGHALKAIARDFDDRGIVNRSGRPFTSQHLRTMAGARLYGGERVHNGERHRAVWPSLVERETWLAVQRLLSDPARRTTRNGRAKHLLSGIAVCDVCSGPMAVAWRNGRPSYQCHSHGCTKVSKDELDELAEAAMLVYLADPANLPGLGGEEGDEGELAALRAQKMGVRAELEDLADQVGRGDISARLAARAEPQILARLEQLTVREQELTTPSVLRSLLPPGADVARRWRDALIAARREIARLVLSADALGELRIARSPTPNRPVPVQERIVWRRTTDHAGATGGGTGGGGAGAGARADSGDGAASEGTGRSATGT